MLGETTTGDDSSGAVESDRAIGRGGNDCDGGGGGGGAALDSSNSRRRGRRRTTTTTLYFNDLHSATTLGYALPDFRQSRAACQRRGGESEWHYCLPPEGLNLGYRVLGNVDEREELLPARLAMQVVHPSVRPSIRLSPHFSIFIIAQ